MKIKKALPLLALAAFCVPSFAGSPQTDVYPKPQYCKIVDKSSTPANELFSAAATNAFLPVAQALTARGIVPTGTLPILSSEKKESTLAFETFNVPAVPGAYVLTVSPSAIEIAALDEAGHFYALQTLAQMIEVDGELQSCTVADYPDVAFRGSVEGFYGKPWEHERRLSQIRFYGKYKMNAYLYGPKDDPYSGFNSDLWRKPYPQEQGKKITDLAETANKNHVQFIWALHPGATIRWTDTDKDGIPDDTLVAVKKFEAMYELGVRAFAVFFDDITGEGTNAKMQAGMLNFINREFVKKKKDVAPLLMCPTEYAGTRRSNYKQNLGDLLDPDINILWTGPEVCSDVPAENTREIAKLWKRKPFIWWNWPVSDYCRTRLLLGRTYGVEKEVARLVSGFVSNPMDKPEASKIALFGIADMTWNASAFDSEKSWIASFPRLFPECAEAMTLFSKHNSDQGGDGYRRQESVEIQPAVNAVLVAYRENAPVPEKEFQQLKKEFSTISDAAKTLELTLPKSNPALWHEIEFWVKSFAKLGEAGTIALALIQSDEYESHASRQEKTNKILAIQKQQYDYFNAQKNRHHEETFESDKERSTGCRVGMRVLDPFITEILSAELKKASHRK